MESEGDIPNDFLLSWKTKAQQRFNTAQSGLENRRQKKLLERFWVSNHYFLSNLLTNGLVSFGDPISDYLNDIKNRILVDDPELAKEIRIYVMKSPITNAFCTSDGVLFINVGLISRLESEAQLAFVICHEISHYTQSHALEGFYDRIKIIKEKTNKYRGLSELNKINLLIARSQEDEFDADEKGMELFMKSGYAEEGIASCFDLLHRSYLPFEEFELDRGFLNTSTFTLPDVFLLDFVAEISAEEDYFDDTHSHPNIHRRRSSLNELLKFADTDSSKKRFIETKERFEEVKILARFETVHQEVLNGNYGDAIYHIKLLQQTYPNSEFLDLSFAKCLYGLALYKSIGKYKYAARSFGKIEGQSQQVHYVLKQLDRRQLTTLALHHLLEAKKRYPGNMHLDEYIDELTLHMFVYCKMKSEDFKVESPQLKPFTQTQTEFKNERAFIRAEKKHFKDFYRYVLTEQYQDNWLVQNLDKHQHARDSIAKEQQITVRAKKKRAKAEEKQLELEGSNLNIDEIIILDPFYTVYGLKSVKDYDKTMVLESEFKNKILGIAKEVGIDVVAMYPEQMDEADVELYNQFSKLKSVIEEAVLFHNLKLKPTSLDFLDSHKGFKKRYICVVGGIADLSSIDWYSFFIYDLKTGKVIYKRMENLHYKISISELEEEFAKDLRNIKN